MGSHVDPPPSVAEVKRPYPASHLHAIQGSGRRPCPQPHDPAALPFLTHLKPTELIGGQQGDSDLAPFFGKVDEVSVKEGQGGISATPGCVMSQVERERLHTLLLFLLFPWLHLTVTYLAIFLIFSVLFLIYLRELLLRYLSPRNEVLTMA